MSSASGPSGRLIGAISKALILLLSLVGEDHQESKDNLGQHVEDGIADNLQANIVGWVGLFSKPIECLDLPWPGSTAEHNVRSLKQLLEMLAQLLICRP